MLTSHSAATERKEVWRGQEKRKNTGLLKCGVDDLRTFIPGYGPPQWLKGKESACNAGDVGLILGLGRSPGGGHGNALQCSCLENPMDRGAWTDYSPLGHKELGTTKATEHQTAHVRL